MRWVGHVVQMDDNVIPKKILWTNPGGQRGHGWLKSRWIDGVEEDARKLGCRNWLADALDRGCRWHLLEEARSTQGCKHHDDDDDDDDDDDGGGGGGGGGGGDDDDDDDDDDLLKIKSHVMKM